MNKVLNHGSLFSGIGGFDIAAEWMGWNNVFHCEWNEFGKQVLNYYWPKAISYDDITKTDFTIHRGLIDILTGGFPCKPYSQAGKRLGKEDDRHLWPEMLRAIREIQPTWVVGENVLGITNWNGGLVFNEVQADLEDEGYEVQPYVLPAASINAPHKRDRVWFVAYSQGQQGERMQFEQREISQQEQRQSGGDCSWLGNRNASNTDNVRLQRSKQANSSEGEKCNDKFSKGCSGEWNNAWEQWPTQPPVCSGNDGFPTGLDGITFSKWRAESIKAYGNAIVPHVVHQIFKAIEKYEQMIKENK